MSIAADVARTASNMNLALTLNWFIAKMESTQREFNRESFPVCTALEMIAEHLTGLERERLQLLQQDRLARESNELAEVLT